MKKFSLMLAVSLLFVSSIFLTACGGDSDKGDTTPNLQPKANKPPPKKPPQLLRRKQVIQQHKPPQNLPQHRHNFHKRLWMRTMRCSNRTRNDRRSLYGWRKFP